MMCSTENGDQQQCYLVLENGAVFPGKAFGARKPVDGEIVFQTGMVGYPESLTDPSYHAQILVLTYPIIGNYGVPGKATDEHGIPYFFESHRIWAAALVVGEHCDHPSHWRKTKTLAQWMAEEQVPGIQGVDTRMLTKMIREKGSMLGKIIYSLPLTDDTAKISDPNLRNLVDEVSIKAPKTYNPKGSPRICAIDCGLKYNQLRCFINRGARVDLVPWNHKLNVNEFDGLFLSNGPGNPEMCLKTIENIRNVMNSGQVKPIFGICLGHQLLSMAIGCSSYKMKYGNRGHNQPCIHYATLRCNMTSQNHGFAINTETLPEGWIELFTNANDKTNEGIAHKSLPYFRYGFLTILFIRARTHACKTQGCCRPLCHFFDTFQFSLKTLNLLTSFAFVVHIAVYVIFFIKINYDKVVHVQG
ncbi:unnamed protein product [Acanthoscelides obtectus]|uniref:Carbamoyl phosphate synthase arginine-specific small chain n=1 Tax=Acanthoscelides obtectus TaxID=200917 RepID=A0A9P0K550_ACAOB|nr:unnamed protein product [Acanthoscelides obtectus]CAK1626786.1 CAD protein [Acanthoscelides obtectus]